MNKLILYAVRNSEGKWFRRKGYGGYGKTWVDDFNKARIYNRIGPARGVISFFANNYKEFPVAELVALEIENVIVLDETNRVRKQQEKKKQAEATRVIRERAAALTRAQNDLVRAQERLSQLKD